MELSEADTKDITDFIANEMALIRSERSELEQTLELYRKMREGEPESAVKNTPHKKASNVCVPMTVIAANTIYGMTKNVFGTKDPPCSVSAYQVGNEKDRATAAVIERYLKLIAESPLDLDKRSKDKVIQYEADTLGTCFVKVAWTTSQWNFVEEVDGARRNITATVHDGPEWIPYPLDSVYYRASTEDIQTASFIALEFQLPLYEVKARGESGRWANVEHVLRNPDTEATSREQTSDALSKVSRMPSEDTFRFLECYLFWDVEPRDGTAEDLIITYHEKSGVILRSQFNELGVRTIEAFRFLHRPFCLEGRGVCHLARHMQSEIDTLHNARNDAIAYGVSPLYGARRNGGLKSREDVHPGRVFFFDDPARDFVVYPTKDVYPGSTQAEMMDRDYLQRATIMSDIMGGFTDPVMRSRDSIGGQMLRLKQGSGVLGSILEGMEDSYSRLWLYTFYWLVRNRSRVIERERSMGRLSPEELESLQEALSIPLEQIPLRLRFRVRTTDAEETYETRKQNLLTMTAIYTMFIRQVLPLQMQAYAVNPQTGQPLLPQPVRDWIQRLIVGQSRLLEQTMKFFGEENTENYIPNYQRMEALLDLKDAMMDQFMKLGGFDGRERGGPRAAALSGMESVPTELGGAGPPVREELGLGGQPGGGAPQPGSQGSYPAIPGGY